MKSTNLHFSWKLLLLLPFVFFLDSCATNPVTGKREIMLVSKGQELAMGQQSDPAIVAQFGLYPDQKLQNFITEKGQQMAKVSHLPDLPYEFKVLDSPVVNAFAVPGGYVYFTRGILAHFNNEAQFAGVLGHEIGHITARHSAKQQTRATIGQVGLIGSMILVPEIAQNAEAAMQGLQLLFLKYGRDAESQSDQLGVEYSTKIGYDAHKMADFFATLDRLSGGSEGRLPTFMSTHPDPADRNRKVASMATDWQQKAGGGEYKVNRDSYLRMIDGIIYGEDPKQGFVENSTFYHPELKFQFPVPNNWQLANSPQQVQMAPKNGKAMMMLTLAQGESLQQAAESTLQEFKLNLVESRENTIGGIRTIEMVADLVQQQQGAQQNAGGQQRVDPNQVIRTQINIVEYNGLYYRFIGLSMLKDFNTYQRTFLNTMRNFKVLNDPDKLNRQPERIDIVSVKNTTTLESALKSNGIPTSRLKEFAVLNGMELQERVMAGMLIKVVDK